MSEKKARIVSREIGDSIAKRIGIDKVLIKNKNNPLAKDALGNALEAIVGAIFLDKGFEQAERFVRQKMISIFEEINQENPDLGINFKNKLLEWGLKEKIEIDFRLVHHNPGPHCTFVSRVYVDGVALGEGKSSTKKGSEQVAAKHALAVLRKKSAPPSSTN
ncbi:putative dsRNA-binding protein [Porphyromonas gingivicanis]|uniref:putative dsRNA-binding protein n=1 Tax=Porphyromonas gingivicanis TaxID=266762 RepID=UPI00046F9BE3|nr:putative dsRNA-binding protein [Porphyromonas gingivicanis]